MKLGAVLALGQPREGMRSHLVAEAGSPLSASQHGAESERRVTVPIVVSFERRTASGELPVSTPEVRARLTNSLVGADQAEVQRMALAANPSRLLCRRRCADCGHQWQQPARTGACPSCHSADVENLHEVPCMALRV